MVAPSGDLVRRLARVNPTVAFVVALALTLAGLFLPGVVGATVLLLIGAGLATLTYLTWSARPPAARVVRVVVLVVLAGVIAAKAIS